MLVVIDCQKKFPASELIVEEVIKEILRAKKRNEWIMLVTVGGRTLYRITRELKGYWKVVKVDKDYDDGSSKIFDRIHGYHWKTLKVHHIEKVRHLRVCGINTSACIMKTVSGLAKFIKVTILSKACANGELEDATYSPIVHHRAALRRMKRWHNVCIV
jgi:hypothetical protein